MMDCERKGKLIGGCRFEPRYDHPVVGPFGASPMWVETRLTVQPDGKTCTLENPEPPVKRYVQDVCIRCGRIAKRGEQA